MLNPDRLHVIFKDDLKKALSFIPRRYTLTHSDRTGDLFLTIGASYDQRKLSNWYVKIMRDEVLGEWKMDEKPSLHIHCHVSGGIVIGSAKWRLSIFRGHLPMVLQAICYGDKTFLQENQKLQTAPVFIHFHSSREKFNQIEQWGEVKDYLPEEK